MFRAFGWYLRWLFWRKFNSVRLSRTGLPQVPPGRPIIICSAHPSWWDPAFLILLQAKLFPGQTGFGPMDAEALGKYRMLQQMGIFGIELDTPRGAAHFLKTCTRILSDPRRVLWITVQGEFADIRQRPLGLRPGIAHLLRRVPDAVVLPLALEYTFWNEVKPEALARFGPPIPAGGEHSVAQWTRLLEDELTRTMDGLAAESLRRDPRLFHRLMQGSTGGSPVYNAFRRLRALARGQTIDVSHGGRE